MVHISIQNRPYLINWCGYHHVINVPRTQRWAQDSVAWEVATIMSDITHGDIMKSKLFLYYWPDVRIMVDLAHKGPVMLWNCHSHPYAEQGVKQLSCSDLRHLNTHVNALQWFLQAVGNAKYHWISCKQWMNMMMYAYVYCICSHT